MTKKRAYFKDLTPGEIQWIKVSASQVSVDGVALARTSYLYYRPDGTSGFDDFSPKLRATIFAVLDSPNVRQITGQYDRVLQASDPADADYRNANFAILNLRDQIPFDSLPLPRADAKNNLNLEDEEVQQRIADVIEKIDASKGSYPTNEPGNLTAADRAIVIDPNGPNNVVATPLTAEEARAVGIEGYEVIELVTRPSVAPLVVTSVEAQAAGARKADYERLDDKKNEASLLAAGQQALGITERNAGVRIVSVADPGTFFNNKTVTARDNKGREFVLNRDEYIASRDALFAIAQEEENELRYFRTWAEEAGRPKSEIDIVFSDPNGLNRLADNKDYQRHLADVKAESGKLPFATPATDAQVDNRLDILLEQLQAQNSKTNPVDGGVADKLESTNNADTATATALSEDERARLAANTANDALKRDIIQNGTAPVVAPTVVAASQSAVVEVQADAAAPPPPPGEGSNSGVNRLNKTVTDSTNSAGDVAVAVQNNPLDEYESYTYGIALHVLDRGEYDKMAQNAKQWTPQHTLIASAGRWNQSGDPNSSSYTSGDFKRAKGWEDNFYFDNLKMTQLQSPSVIGRGTNTIDMEFTIIEPYGLTLLDRMIRTTNDLKEESYMHLCYMLQIDFFDSAKGLLIDHRKFIPIQLIGMNIKVSGKGTQYIVNATPFHHRALMNMITTTPQHVDVLSGTLRDVFADDNASSEATGSEAANNTYREEQEKNQVQGSAAAPSAGSVAAAAGTAARILAAGGSASEKRYQISSYVAMYNGWWKTMKQLNVTDQRWDPQNIKVRFADEIIKFEKLTKPTNTVVGSGPMAKSDAKQGVVVPESNQFEGFSFKAGSNIIEVINTVMLSSEYIRRQVLIPDQNQSKAGPIINTVNWWKVLPQVKLNGFDNVLNRWSYSITYFVVPYLIWNTKHPNLPKQSPRRANCVKQYNYLYTGDNRSVIDFQVEFDMLYFTTVAGFKQYNIDDSDRNEHGGQDSKSAAGKDSNDRGPNSNTVAPVTLNLVPQDARAGDNLQKDATAVALGTIQDSIYSGANGEMLTVNMKIIGDPTLVKQDDLFINIGEYYDASGRSQSSDGIKLGASHHQPGAAPAKLNNNSIVTDAGEVLAWVQVLMPPDIDENTGGLRLGEGASSTNSFTGVYKIMEVQNEFSQGKFIQTLVLIRYQEQDADKDYRKALADEKNSRIVGAGPADQTILARTTGSGGEVDSVVSSAQSPQIASSSTAPVEEPNIVQTASAVQPPQSVALIDAGNFPESVIEQTDLA